MRSFAIRPCKSVKGEISLPGDKSISHRALILSSIAEGKTTIRNFPFSEDCLATLEALSLAGIPCRRISSHALKVEGKGLFGLSEPKSTLSLKESGTSARLLTGLLAGQAFSSKLDGYFLLRKRPMARVIQPLLLMGANISARKINNNLYLPIIISPSKLKSIHWKMKIPSAQVKSAILLAGLYSKGTTVIYEPVASRDHTERMMKLFKVKIRKSGSRISVSPSVPISPKEIVVPGDISSASFFIVLAALKRNSWVRIKKVSLNSTRIGLISALRKMGASIRIKARAMLGCEPVCDLFVKSSRLRGVSIKRSDIPSVIDELPILMVAASLAEGRSLFEGVEELRVKEVDRIKSMAENLKKMGVLIEIKNQGNKEVIEIEGAGRLTGAKLKSFNDHRTAMSMVIAGLLAEKPSTINDIDCINKSFPQFLDTLNHLVVK